MTDVHHKPEYSTPAGNILTERKSCPVITIEPVWTIVTFSKKNENVGVRASNIEVKRIFINITEASLSICTARK